MKQIKFYFLEIFARIWAAWGLLTFVSTFLIIIIPALLTGFVKGAKGQYLFIKVSKIWMTVWLTLIGCTIKVKGKEHFKKGKTYILTFNHNTFLDVPLSCPFIPGPNKTIAKKSMSKIPLFGLFYKRGSVLVDRKDDRSRRLSYEYMKKVLAQNIYMCIYPEGSRNRTKELLKPFYDGAFKLAVETKTNIIPSLLFNTGKAMPVNKFFYLLPQRLEMHFLEPVSSENITSKELNEKVYSIMLNYYKNNL